jgi:hypothetical protein
MKTRAEEATRSVRGRKTLTPTSASVRSAISNGSALLPDLDHRSAWSRRLRDLIASHVSDLGGEDLLSAAELALVRRAAMLTLQLELLEQRFSENERGKATPSELNEYQRATNSLRRVLEALGVERRSIDVTPGTSATRSIIKAIEERRVVHAAS